MEKFFIGMLLGGVGGALLIANNYKMRTLVKKSQEEVQNKLNELLDEKIKEMDGFDDFNASGQKLDPETDLHVPPEKKTAPKKKTAQKAEKPAAANA